MSLLFRRVSTVALMLRTALGRGGAGATAGVVRLRTDGADGADSVVLGDKLRPSAGGSNTLAGTGRALQCGGRGRDLVRGTVSARRSGRRSVLLVCLLVGAGLVLASPALAINTHVLSTTFGSASSTPSNPYPLSAPASVAVDEASGAVYVADPGNDWVEKFDSSGNLVWIAGGGVDKTTGANLCTIASGDTCQAGTAGSGSGEYSTPQFLAVDNSGGPSDGDVYVADTGDNLVTKLDPSGNVISSWGDQTPADGQLSGQNASNGPFSPLIGVTVDAAGNLWVAKHSATYWFEFGQEGSPLQTVRTGGAGAPIGIAIDQLGDLYQADANGNDAVDESAPTGGIGGGYQITDDQTAGLSGFALDPSNDDLYADDGAGLIRHYDASTFVGCAQTRTCTQAGTGTAADTFGSGELNGAQGLAVDGTTGAVYVADTGDGRVDVFTPAVLPDVETGQASGAGPSSATLNGTVNPDGTTITDCHFEYVDDGDYDPSASDPYSAGGSVPCSSTPSGSSPVAVSAQVSGLSPVTEYHFRLVAGNSSGESYGSDVTFVTPNTPSIDSESASDVGISTATLNGQINPDDGDTTYHFEYGSKGACSSNPCTSVPVPDADAGSGSNDLSVSQAISGLTANTTYWWRLVATNSVGTADGADQTFTTFAQSTPPSGSCSNSQFRVGPGADLPDCRAYEQATPVNKDGSEPAGGPLNVAAADSGDGVTYFSFGNFPGGPDTGAANFARLVSSRSAAGWSTQGVLAPQRDGDHADVLGWTPDLSDVFDAVGAPSTESLYELSSADGAPTQVFSAPYSLSSPLISNVTSDGSEVLFEDQEQLLPSAAANKVNSYVWDRASGALSLVGVLPDGSTPSGGSMAGYGGTYGNYQDPNPLSSPNALSSDGSRAFWTAPDSGELYVRENPTSADASTVQVSASQKTNGSGPGGTDPNGPQPAQFWAATPDGSQVFFTSQEELTNDANTGDPSSCGDCGEDLYDYDVNTGQLTDLTPDSNPADSNGASVQGVLGASDDGSYVYFAAGGQLASGAPPSNGNDNLYVWHDGTITYVTQLSGNDSNDWNPAASSLTSRVTPDGQTLLFGSTVSLTGYDNQGTLEFYRYTVAGGTIDCVSCDPSGAAPLGPPDLETATNPLASNQPTLEFGFLSRNLSASGDQVFFDSPDALTARDTDGVQNVYEWEADGAGSCDSTAQHGGCLYSISTGESPDASYFADASASGNDVFFFTDQPLVGQDQDQLLDVYDARVDGGLASQWPSPATPCTAQSCRTTTSAPPPAPTVGTVSFTGPGNAAAPAVTGRVRVVKKAVHGTTFVLTVKVPERGRIAISGAWVKKAGRSVARAGTFKLTVHLTAAAKRALKHARKLKVKVSVRFTPPAGKAVIATVNVEVKR